MSVAPSPSSSRGEIVLQPAYFTSSAFVHAARADVERLVQHYSQQYTLCSNHPFTLFKDIWQTHGWSWIHFRVFDARSRASFLRVIMRLFSERIAGREAPLNRVAALFGLYTIFCTQPSATAPSLYSVAQVEVTCDVYEEIVMLPDALDGALLLPVRPYAIYVQSRLMQAHAFHILPHAEVYPLSPRVLPREVVGEGATTQEGKKKGRPSRQERVKKARDALAALDVWRSEVLVSPPETGTVYAAAKSKLMSVAEDELREAGSLVAERMEMLGQWVNDGDS